MTMPPNSSGSEFSNDIPDSSQSTSFLTTPNLPTEESTVPDTNGPGIYPALESAPFKPRPSSNLPKPMTIPRLGSGLPSTWSRVSIIGGTIAVMLVGLVLNLVWLSIPAAIVALALSLQVIGLGLRPIVRDLISIQQWNLTISILAGLVAVWGLLRALGTGGLFLNLSRQINWDAVGALGEVFGALGQILIAILALYVAWRQYVIERDLTMRQNLITQQQTIDSYFQGISELVVDDEGLLEDWPQERAIAEARTAAILGSVDADGKAKIIRFLSRANLLTPLKRDQRLGRAILDGTGGYAEDRQYGIRVVDLGIMLAGTNLSGTDLRWTDLSEANLIRADLSQADLVRCNLSRAILVDANLEGADLKGVRLFYGRPEEASPRSQTEPPDYHTGEHSGAVIEGADFSGAEQMSPDQRYYCCAWGGARTRLSIPGGCEGIPNKLNR